MMAHLCNQLNFYYSCKSARKTRLKLHCAVGLRTHVYAFILFWLALNILKWASLIHPLFTTSFLVLQWRLRWAVDSTNFAHQPAWIRCPVRVGGWFLKQHTAHRHSFGLLLNLRPATVGPLARKHLVDSGTGRTILSKHALIIWNRNTTEFSDSAASAR